MKRVLHTGSIILVIVFYTLSIAGLSFNKHFCDGVLEEVTFIKNGVCCEGETDSMPDDCCSNETVVVSAYSESISNDLKIFPEPAELLTIFTNPGNADPLPCIKFLTTCYFKSKIPPKSQTELRVLRI